LLRSCSAFLSDIFCPGCSLPLLHSALLLSPGYSDLSRFCAELDLEKGVGSPESSALHAILHHCPDCQARRAPFSGQLLHTDDFRTHLGHGRWTSKFQNLDVMILSWAARWVVILGTCRVDKFHSSLERKKTYMGMSRTHPVVHAHGRLGVYMPFRHYGVRLSAGLVLISTPSQESRTTGMACRRVLLLLPLTVLLSPIIPILAPRPAPIALLSLVLPILDRLLLLFVPSWS
jgi:hypothetical protein